MIIYRHNFIQINNGFGLELIRGIIPEYRDGPVSTTVIPINSNEGLKKTTKKVKSKTNEDFRVKFRENFRVKFSVTGNQLDRMNEMILMISSEKVLVVKDLSEEFEVSVRTIHEDISRLEKWGIVIFEGAPKTGKYALTEKGKRLLEEIRK